MVAPALPQYVWLVIMGAFGKREAAHARKNADRPWYEPLTHFFLLRRLWVWVGYR
jgi:hypothetical protein